jgi:cytoskeletal protein CcmA (bactofilin family)
VVLFNISKRVFGKIKNEFGFAVPLALAVLVLLSTLGFSVYFLAESDLSLSQHEEYQTKALHIAEAGINDYIWHMNKDENYYKNYTHEAEGKDAYGNDKYVNYQGGQYHLDVTPTSETAPGVILEATGRIQTADGNYVYRKVKAQIRKRSFVNYLYLSDYETVEGTGSKIWFITGDTIHGPLHSNDTININGNPVFEAKVTTSKTLYKKSGSNPDFQQGYKEHVTPLDFPPTNTELKLTSQVGGYYYYGETTIVLNSAGTVTITNNDTSGQTKGPTGTVFLPSNGVIYVDGVVGTKGNKNNGDVYIQGTLSGRLTVAAANNIYIKGDLIYQDSANDMLGLVAQNYVYILHYNLSGQDVAPINPEINAAIFALNHSFTYEKYSQGSVKGTLTVRGSITQRFRGPVGTFNPGTGSPVSGYSKNYWYDQRMLYTEPPYFIEPLNSGFERVFWEEEKVQ